MGVPAKTCTIAADSNSADAARNKQSAVVRKRFADAEGVPAYIIFSDAVLRQMTQSVPRTREALLALSGVGPVKLKRYGEEFLEVLRQA